MKTKRVEKIIQEKQVYNISKLSTCGDSDDNFCDAYLSGGYCKLFEKTIPGDFIQSRKYSSLILRKRLKECIDEFKNSDIIYRNKENE